MVQLYQPNAYDTDQASLDAGIEFTEPSMTKQSLAHDADINTIVERFGLGQEIPPDFQSASFADFSEVVDFHTAMNAIRSAGESFMELPGKLRERFQNDPQNLMHFLGDKTNLQEAIGLGLVSPRLQPLADAPAPAPAPAPVAKGDTSSST